MSRPYPAGQPEVAAVGLPGLPLPCLVPKSAPT